MNHSIIISMLSSCAWLRLNDQGRALGHQIRPVSIKMIVCCQMKRPQIIFQAFCLIMSISSLTLFMERAAFRRFLLLNWSYGLWLGRSIKLCHLGCRFSCIFDVYKSLQSQKMVVLHRTDNTRMRIAFSAHLLWLPEVSLKRMWGLQPPEYGAELQFV